MTGHPARAGSREVIQLAAAGIGVVLLLLGVLGFVPGATSHVGDLRLGPAATRSELLGLLPVTLVRNLLHLGLGVVGLVTARTVSTAQTYLVGGGVGYVVLWAYGHVVVQAASGNTTPVDAVDGWFHLVLGSVMVALGVALSRRAALGPLRTPDEHRARVSR